MEAIILAGGVGSRLRSVVNDRPKVLALISEQPFLKYIIDFLIGSGVTKLVFSLGYLSSQITDFVSELQLDMNYEFSIENKQLGTGGAIKKAINFVNDENVIIVNADTYFNVNLRNMMKQHIFNNADCTISLKYLINFNRYGTVIINDDNKITSFIEKKQTENGFISAGYLIINKKKFQEQTHNFPEIFSLETDYLQKISNTNIYGYISDGFFIDIGIPEDYLFAQNYFKKIIQNNI
jgi:D-glycero-alpha-D-manno-heptose 1-phosphate guanylyltransferase